MIIEFSASLVCDLLWRVIFKKLIVITPLLILL
jgi:hypothetical protein